VIEIFRQVKGPTESVLRQLLADTRLSEQVTYKRFDSESYNSSLGYNVASYTSYSLTGINLKHNSQSVAVATTKVQVGEPVYVFNAEDMPDGISLKDVIVDSKGNELKVKAIQNIFDIAVSITVESGGLQ